MAGAFRQVHPSLEEAARISGASTRELLLTIWFPLLRRTFAAAWLLMALPMLTELTMSVLLTGPGAATLGTVLFQLQEYADQPSAAALAWMLLTVALAVSFFTAKEAKAEA
jgi:iron(III) transport system permease protein